jgi:hypothetical protein
MIIRNHRVHHHTVVLLVGKELNQSPAAFYFLYQLTS